MDVHPPLAKMLIALVGWLAGFDGEFDFKDIGKDYLEPGVPYVAMRMFPAACGILLAPCMFFTLKALGCRTPTALIGSGAIIFGARKYLGPERPKSLLNIDRERPLDPGSPYPPRLSSRCRNRLHRLRLFLLHQQA